LLSVPKLLLSLRQGRSRFLLVAETAEKREEEIANDEQEEGDDDEPAIGRNEAKDHECDGEAVHSRARVLTRR
jgi:hypothetical protein